jgi:hypothetical protein
MGGIQQRILDILNPIPSISIKKNTQIIKVWGEDWLESMGPDRLELSTSPLSAVRSTN